MVGLPLVIGSKSIASRYVNPAQPMEVFDGDDVGNDGPSILVPSTSRGTATIVTAMSSDQQLLAVIAIYYYHMLRQPPRSSTEEQEVAYSVAELHIQISFMGQPTSLRGRDSIHRIPLRSSPSPSTSSTSSPSTSPSSPSPSNHQSSHDSTAVFSWDRRFLTCLIVHPVSSATTEPQEREPPSTVVVFQLRKPKTESPVQHLPPPPLPPYMIGSSNANTTTPILPVATNPRTLPIHNASALCNVTSSSSLSLSSSSSLSVSGGSILIGCWDGSVYYMNHVYRRPFTATCVQALCECDDSRTNATTLPIIAIDHCLEDSPVVSDRGRLVVLFQDGNVVVYQSHFSSESSPNQPNHNHHHNSETTLTHDESESESHRQWDMSDSGRSTHQQYAADPRTWHTPNNYGFQLHRIQDFRCYCLSASSMFRAAKWITSDYLILIEAPKNSESTIHVFRINGHDHNEDRLQPLSTMTMTKELLEESSDNVPNPDTDNLTMHAVRKNMTITLDYDRHCGCVAITSYVNIGTDGTSTSRRSYLFSCLWNWRANVLGYTTCHAPNRQNEIIQSVSSYFGIDPAQRRKFVCVTSAFNSTQHTVIIQKESYNMAIISPPYESSYQIRPAVRESTLLLLSADSVSYPIITTTSNLKNYEIDWMESRIPTSYLSSYDAPHLATIGKRYGRSIAIASSRGVCVLDRGNDVRTTIVSSAPKWRLFANESHEKQFRVVAFSWWEGPMKSNSSHQSKVNHGFFDDILVAVIEVVDNRDDSGFFLSCWSVRNIELSSQLVKSTFKWGLQLPANFIPSCIDLLASPNMTTNDYNTASVSERLATVIINDTSMTTNYRIFQLRLQVNTASTADLNVNIVSARCTAFGSIGSSVGLFIASSSFTKERDDGGIDDEYTVLGVIRQHGVGLNAILVSNSTTHYVAERVASTSTFSNEMSRDDVAQYWLADIVYGNGAASTNNTSKSLEWIFQLADGRLMSWSIPFPFTINQLNAPFQKFDEFTSNSDPNSHILGNVTPAGTATSWMQQSTRGAQSNFRGGTVPHSAFGYFVGTNQSYKKVTTPLAENIPNHSFRANVHHHTVLRPGDMTLYPPAYLPSLYVQTVATQHNKVNEKECSYDVESYIRTKMVSREQQDMAVLSLQLIVLRLCEKLAKISQSHDSTDLYAYSRGYDSLISIVRMIRNSTNPLQFAIFFITLGRQMEISCLQHLFPLPETLDDLYRIAATHGSIPTSVSTLPILTDKKSTILKCTDMFHVCVDRLDGAFQPPLRIENVCTENDFYSAGEIFRYALKTHDNIPGCYRRFANESDNNDENDDDDNDATRRSTIMCGMTKLFGVWNTSGSSTKVPITAQRTSDQTPLLIHGITDSKIMKLNDYGVTHLRKLSRWPGHSSVDIFTNVSQVTARFMVSSIFGGDTWDNQIGWIKVALLSMIVMCDMSPDNRHGSVHTFSQFMDTFKVSRCLALAPLDVRRDGLAKVLDYFMRNCHDGIDPDVASCVFDLVVVLLGCDTTSFTADIPGLVLIAMVAAHKADRILDMLAPESDSALSVAYFELCTKQTAW